MAFADDLLKDAHHLAGRGGKNPKQSSLRRAVSTAYYALFHLLIADFVLNWRRPDQRVRLGRMFEQGKMKQAKFRSAWRIVRQEKIAQDHLLTMFGARPDLIIRS